MGLTLTVIQQWRHMEVRF